MLYSKELKTFVTIVKTGSYSAAARELFVSQSALTRQIKLLEEDLGFLLFERLPFGIRLTPEGESFYTKAGKLVELAEDILSASRAPQSEDLPLRIALTMTHTFDFLRRACLLFEKQHPQTKLSFCYSSNPPKPFEELSEEQFDLFFSYTIAIQEQDFPQLGHTKILEDRVMLGVHPGHPLGDKERIAPEELLPYPLFMIPEGYVGGDYDHLYRLLSDIRPSAHIRPSRFSRSLFLQAEMEKGIIIAAKHYLKDKPVRSIPLDAPDSMPLYLFHAASPSSAVKDFIRVARQTAEEN